METAVSEDKIPEVKVIVSVGYVKKQTLALVRKWAKPKSFEARLFKDGENAWWVRLWRQTPRVTWWTKTEEVELGHVRLEEDGSPKYLNIYGDHLSVEEGQELARVLGLSEITLY